MGVHYERVFYYCLDLGQIFGLMREKKSQDKSIPRKSFARKTVFHAKVARNFCVKCGNQLSMIKIKGWFNTKITQRCEGAKRLLLNAKLSDFNGGQQKHVTHPTFKTRGRFQLSVISYQLSVSGKSFPRAKKKTRGRLRKKSLTSK